MKINTYLSSFDLDVLKEYKKAFPNSELNVLISYGTVTSDYYDMAFIFLVAKLFNTVSYYREIIL